MIGPALLVDRLLVVVADQGLSADHQFRFTASVLTYVVTPWLCGFAQTLGMHIVFRILQDLVAGPMILLSQALRLSTYPPERSGTALSMTSLAPEF